MPNTVKWDSGSRQKRKLFLANDTALRLGKSLRKRKRIEDEELERQRLNIYL